MSRITSLKISFGEKFDAALLTKKVLDLLSAAAPEGSKISVSGPLVSGGGKENKLLIQYTESADDSVKALLKAISDLLKLNLRI